MIKYEIDKVKQGKIEIPEKSGLYVFYNKDTISYMGKSANLRQTIPALLKVTEEPYNEVHEKSDSISWEVIDNMFSVLLAEKAFLQKNSGYTPPFRSFDVYQYLGIDFLKVPYFHFEETTIDNFYFLGPFPNRFLLYDFLDTLTELFKFPFCESDNYPCEKMTNNRCKGYCLEDNSILVDILRSHYFRIPEKELDLLRKKADGFYDDLEFEKSSNLKEQLAVLDRFYDYLKFLHVTKNINLDYEENGLKFHFLNGMLEKVTESEFDTFYPVSNLEYSNMEFLAVDKSELAERRIIYNFLKDKFPIQFDALYRQSLTKLAEIGV